jgi:hypothetical protein
MKSFRRSSLSWLFTLTAFAVFGFRAEATPILDGQILPGEGWLHLTENPYAQPVAGGLTTHSDLVGETATQHRWDDQANLGAGADVDLGSPRGDVQNMYVAFSSTFLYLAVVGPTVPFRDWNPYGEQGDLYVAIDTRGGAADPVNDSLSASAAHSSFRGSDPQAVDFLGWRPTYFIGVDWVQNNGFTTGAGYANLEQAGTHQVIAGEGHFQNDGGFEWAAGIDGLSRGVYEFQVLWTDLGYGAGGPGPGAILRLAMYTTAEYDFYDVYDSGPGVGQPQFFEEIGDNPNDPDAGDFGGFVGTLGATDGLGQPGGSLSGSFPSSNFVNPLGSNYDAVPNHFDGIDTIQEYFSVAIIPEPQSFVLVALAALALGARFGRRRPPRA